MVNSTPNNHLVSAFDDTYVSILKNVYAWYTKKMTLELIHNLYTHYAQISATDMSANDERPKYPYNAEEPLEGIIERLNECADLAAAETETVSKTQLVRIACGLIEDTGQHLKDCREWST